MSNSENNDIPIKSKLAELLAQDDDKKTSLFDIKKEVIDDFYEFFSEGMIPEVTEDQPEYFSQKNPIYRMAYWGIDHGLTLCGRLWDLNKRLNDRTQNVLKWEYSEYYSIFSRYFLLEECCLKRPKNIISLYKSDNAEKYWINRTDMFFPDEWPYPSYVQFTSMTHAAAYFALYTYREMNKHVSQLGDINTVFVNANSSDELTSCIAKMVEEVIKLEGISIHRLINSVKNRIEYELKLFLNKHQKENINPDQESFTNDTKNYRNRIAKDEANVRAREILKQNPNITARDLAKEIGCSQGLISKLPAWQAVMEKRRQGCVPKTSPKTVSLTKGHESIIADNSDDEDELAKLIKDQEADQKADEGKYFRQRKKL